MRKSDITYKIYNSILIFLLCTLAGCSKESSSFNDKQSMKTQESEGTMQTETTSTEEKTPIEEASKNNKAQKETPEPIVSEVDLSNYFDEINGAAVIYAPLENRYHIYNHELARTKRSPCSTFKIISSLIALENGIIEPDDSTRTWSGEIFWSEEWNRDIDFSDAFHASCVWYFREIIDEIGKELIQKELNRLEYGNCDISDWDGRLNTNNSNPALTGFWIESSLLISPKEQVEVLERIFGEKTDYSQETLNQLKQVMLLSGQDESGISIYGKTGMGKAHGIVVDSWFTGFADSNSNGERIYFCVYLGETEDKDVSSAKAREIAVEIVSEYLY